MARSLGTRIAHKLIRKYIAPDLRISYSQFGEDEILFFLFDQLDIERPTYLDIGANEPRFISNTFYFYEQGSSGVLIEPNPFLSKKLKKIRPRDTVLNCGVGIEEAKEADFFLFPDFANGLGTFSASEATHWQEVGVKGWGPIPLEKVIKVPLVPVGAVLMEHFPNAAPTFISIDVEGLDFEVLKSIDFTKHRPVAVCVETMAYDGSKRPEIAAHMAASGYSVYADTRVNTIFLRGDVAA